MASIPLKWDSNFRANLALWPKVLSNIAALVKCDGQPYVEEELLKTFPAAQSEQDAPAEKTASMKKGKNGATKFPKDSRAVRNAYEALALTGLAYKETASPPILRLSDLGISVFTFLGVIGDKSFANEKNRRVLADVMISGLSIVVEYRAIWMLLRSTNGLLTNDELNRAMQRIQYLEDVEETGQVVLAARSKNDPKLIGPRLYNDEEYDVEGKRTDQRKVINPQFLLAGGGRLFISMEDGTDFRRLEDWAVPLIDRRLEDPSTLIHASTDEESVRLMSENACVTSRLWREW